MIVNKIVYNVVYFFQHLSELFAAGFGTCALNKEPFKNSNGQQRVCSGPEVEKCPDDYKCKHLASFGVCCPKKSEGQFSFFSSCLKLPFLH